MNNSVTDFSTNNLNEVDEPAKKGELDKSIYELLESTLSDGKKLFVYHYNSSKTATLIIHEHNICRCIDAAKSSIKNEKSTGLFYKDNGHYQEITESTLPATLDYWVSEKLGDHYSFPLKQELIDKIKAFAPKKDHSSIPKYSGSSFFENYMVDFDVLTDATKFDEFRLAFKERPDIVVDFPVKFNVDLTTLETLHSIVEKDDNTLRLAAVRRHFEQTAPKWFGVVKKWVGEEQVNLFLELLGCTLDPKNRFKKLFWLEGEPNTGKTTISNVIMYSRVKSQPTIIRDHGPIASVTVGVVEDPQRFTYSQILNSVVTLVPECGMISKPERFNVLSGNDILDIESKYGGVSRGIFTGKIIAYANSYPKFKEKSNYYAIDAFKNRLVTIKYRNNQFKKDPNFVQHMFTSENDMEFEIMLNLALYSYWLVAIRNGEFTTVKYSDLETDLKYDSGLSFINELITTKRLVFTDSESDFITYERLSEEYKVWTTTKGLTEKSVKSGLKGLSSSLGRVAILNGKQYKKTRGKLTEGVNFNKIIYRFVKLS